MNERVEQYQRDWEEIFHKLAYGYGRPHWPMYPVETHETHLQWLLDRIDEQPTGVFIDCGCGPGNVLRIAEREGQYHSIVGVEPHDIAYRAMELRGNHLSYNVAIHHKTMESVGPYIEAPLGMPIIVFQYGGLQLSPDANRAWELLSGEVFPQSLETPLHAEFFFRLCSFTPDLVWNGMDRVIITRAEMEEVRFKIRARLKELL